MTRVTYLSIHSSSASDPSGGIRRLVLSDPTSIAYDGRDSGFTIQDAAVAPCGQGPTAEEVIWTKCLDAGGIGGQLPSTPPPHTLDVTACPSSPMPSANRLYRLEDTRLRVIVDPACGGKIRSLVSLRTGREYLYQDPRTSFAGRGYSEHDITGMDECFPTVLPCNFPHGRWQGLALGDHGWLWDRPWEVESTSDSITTAIDLSEVPIHFERTCRLVGPGQLQLEYAIENRADEPFEFLYANHLLLFADTSTRIDYPSEMRRAYVSVSYFMDGTNDRSWIDWPPPRDLGVTEPFDSRRGTLIKLFSQRLKRGDVGIFHGQDRESLRIEFGVERLPILGILLAQGFSPTQRDCQGLFVGLEATTGMGDDLASCRATNTSDQLEPGEVRRFHIKLSLTERFCPNLAL